MTLASALTALCDMLRTHTGADVILGRPDDGAPGIYVWPWRLEEDGHRRDVPLRLLPTIHFLVLARPAFTLDGLSTLEMARLAILDHPILDVAGRKAQVLISPLAGDDLAALFTASSLPLTICLSALLREVP